MCLKSLAEPPIGVLYSSETKADFLGVAQKPQSTLIAKRRHDPYPKNVGTDETATTLSAFNEDETEYLSIFFTTRNIVPAHSDAW
jgi:hypothetical protein